MSAAMLVVLGGFGGGSGGSATTAAIERFAQEAYLKAPNADAYDRFGWSVAVDGDTVVVGAVLESSNQTTVTNGTAASADNSKPSSGAAYVFKRTGTSWAPEAYLKAANAESGDWFGNSVAVDGDTVVVGAFLESGNRTTIPHGATASADNSASGAGAAYVFKRTGATWAPEAYLKAPNAEAHDSFGASVAIKGDTVVVGAGGERGNRTPIANGATASADDSKPSSGAAYVFKRTGASWVQAAYLKEPNAQAGDRFGQAVAFDGDTAVVGAIGESSNQTAITNGATASADNSAPNSGAVYVFRNP